MSGMWIESVVGALCIGLIGLSSGQSCTNLHYGRSCRNRCRCATLTYACRGGDCAACDVSSGYSSPPKCQRVNVALKKPTQQKNAATGYASEKGVDGSRGTCSQTLGDRGDNWWQVDLGREYDIKWLELYNTLDDNCYDWITRRTIQDCEDLVRGFRVHISNTSMIATSASYPPDSTLCYTDDQSQTLTDVRPINIECTRPQRGRYVLVSLPGINSNRLTVCELNVFQCEVYFFGRYCNNECNCRSDSEICDMFTGACPKSGCMEGYGGTDCLSRSTDRQSDEDTCVGAEMWGIIGGVVGGFVLGVGLAAIAFVCWRRRNGKLTGGAVPNDDKECPVYEIPVVDMNHIPIAHAPAAPAYYSTQVDTALATTAPPTAPTSYRKPTHADMALPPIPPPTRPTTPAYYNTKENAYDIPGNTNEYEGKSHVTVQVPRYEHVPTRHYYNGGGYENTRRGGSETGAPAPKQQS